MRITQPPTIVKEFSAFLREYNIIALALAFVMGAASNQLVKSLVDNVMMPFITPLIPADRWQDATLQLGPVALRWGRFFADFLHFAILAVVVFIIAKKLFRFEKVGNRLSVVSRPISIGLDNLVCCATLKREGSVYAYARSYLSSWL